MHVFRHPKFYEEYRKRAKRYQKELRERNKSDQAISDEASTEATSVRPGPGQTSKQQASSYKLPGPRPISNANKGLIHKRQASSTKPQAPSKSKTLEQDS